MLKKIIAIIIIIVFISLMIFGIIYFLNKNRGDVQYQQSQELTKIPILLYHDVVTVIPESDPYNFEYITTIDSFEENIKTLLSDGYSIITIKDLYNLEKDNKEIPSKPVIINFDDGLISNYELIFPILKKYNIKIGMSITTDLVGTEDTIEGRKYFSWDQAKEMYDSGLVEFYSHGKRHVYYSSMSVIEFKKEIIESTDVISSKLNTECDVFVYPYGSYNNYMVSVLKDSNIKIQLYDSGVNRLKNINYHFMKRMNIPYGMTGKDIISYIKIQ